MLKNIKFGQLCIKNKNKKYLSNSKGFLGTENKFIAYDLNNNLNDSSVPLEL